MTRPVPEPAAERLFRVVIADGDPDTRTLYREALEGLPLEIVEAGDGRDALVQCLMERPALLIADTQLATIDGYQLCQLLRRDDATHTLPILMVTSESRPAELTRLRHMGATHILSKPLALDGFSPEVQRLCEGVDPGPTGIPAPGCVQAKSRNFRRFDTTTPPQLPPGLRCRACDQPLDYQRSRVGGVSQNNPEQWDRFRCPQCSGHYEYRHRTKTVRAVD